jgi:hypothetical protein
VQIPARAHQFFASREVGGLDVVAGIPHSASSGPEPVEGLPAWIGVATDVRAVGFHLESKRPKRRAGTPYLYTQLLNPMGRVAWRQG